MPSLPSTPWTDILDYRVAVDAPVSTDLMTDMVVDLNYLKSTLTDGATAPQDINGKNVTANGDLHVTGNSQFDGNVNISGVLSVGTFFSTEQLLLLVFS